MHEPEQIEARMVDLARRLLRQTTIGRAAWKRAARRDQFIYAARTGSVVVERDGSLHTLRALDPVGNEVERLDVLPPTTGLAEAALPPDAFPTVAELWTAAERSARQSETLLDELIAEIG